MESRFHLSLPCLNVKETRAFYVELIGAKIGRSATYWIDVDLFGHQITFAKTGAFDFQCKSYSFEGTILPAFHLGVILHKKEWNNMLERLTTENQLTIPKTSFLVGQKGAHQSFFVTDPNGYLFEFKCFDKENEVFEN
ncbi:MAG: bleomycin resistance protein [Flavobacteriales bacterium]|nr:bleomycin resistance protein [Flavobacteriales bacterium]